MTSKFPARDSYENEQFPLIKHVAQQWQLTDVKPLANLSYHYVATAYSTKYAQTVVFKIGSDHTALEREANALAWYGGKGCVKLLDFDREVGALLLEYVKGKTLKTFFPQDDIAAVYYAVYVMRDLQRMPIAEDTAAMHKKFPTIAQLLKTLEIPRNGVPGKHRLRALELGHQLVATQGQLVLLHGDLHHENILISEDSKYCVAIDPKGVIGEPAYEVAAFIRNPMPELLEQKNAVAIIESRIHLFSRLLNIDAQRIRDWTYVEEILAAQWAVEDGVSPAYFLKMAELVVR